MRIIKGIVVVFLVVFALVAALGPPVWAYLASRQDFAAWLKDYQELTGASLSGVLLIGAAIIALWQLRSEGRTRYGTFLLDLSDKWDSDAVISARHQVDVLLREIEEELRTKGTQPNLQQAVRQELARRLKELEEGTDKRFFVLTSVLEFLETLGYLVRNKHIPLEDVRNTFGPAMSYYYKWFECHIEDQRKDPENQDVYENLERIVKRLDKPPFPKRLFSPNAETFSSSRP